MNFQIHTLSRNKVFKYCDPTNSFRALIVDSLDPEFYIQNYKRAHG